MHNSPHKGPILVSVPLMLWYQLSPGEDGGWTGDTCALSRSLPFDSEDSPIHQHLHEEGMLTKTHDASGCNQSPVQLISWVPRLDLLSTASQWNVPFYVIFPNITRSDLYCLVRQVMLIFEFILTTWSFSASLSVGTL